MNTMTLPPFSARHILSQYILSPIDLVPVRQSSRSFVGLGTGRQHFIAYLQEHESFITKTLPRSSLELYKEFHASHLQRIFLRTAMEKLQSKPEIRVCISGSYPLSIRVRQHRGTCAWLPGDIDIFFSHTAPDKQTGSSMFEMLVEMYTAIVANPLVLEVHSEKSEDYKSSDEEVNNSRETISVVSNIIHTDMSSSESVDSIGSIHSGAAQNLRHISCRPSKQAIHDRIRLYCATVKENIYYGADRHMTQIIIEQLEKILEELPGASVCPDYFVKESCIIQTRTYESLWRQPAVLRDINLIFVKTLEKLPPQKSFAGLICSSFDMAQCAVSLECDSNLAYHTFLHESDAYQLIHDSRIRLTSRAFISGNDAVVKQLNRVVKYIRRGFIFGL